MEYVFREGEKVKTEFLKTEKSGINAMMNRGWLRINKSWTTFLPFFYGCSHKQNTVQIELFLLRKRLSSICKRPYARLYLPSRVEDDF